MGTQQDCPPQRLNTARSAMAVCTSLVMRVAWCQAGRKQALAKTRVGGERGLHVRLRVPHQCRPAHALRAQRSVAGASDAVGFGTADRPPRKKALPPVPACVAPPDLPEDAVWQNAMVLIDKPQDWTSFDLCGKLRSALKIKKVGHAGTLDPMATGLVIVCVGKGTKHVESFMAQEKEYTGTIRLGEATASYDAESDVAERKPWEHVSDEQLGVARDSFLGDIQQMPPMFSAIKIKGKKLYELARKGVEVERKPRAVTVSVFDLERDQGNPQHLNFRVVCSKGTYIRALAHDLGQAAGTAAHLTALRRERIGDYSVNGAWDIVELADRCKHRRLEKQGTRGSAAAAAGSMVVQKP